MNCNYSNDKLSDSEIYRIENQCKTQHHISETESLINLIKADETYIYQNGFTFEQLKNFFEKIKLHFKSNIKNDTQEIKLNDLVIDPIN